MVLIYAVRLVCLMLFFFTIIPAFSHVESNMIQKLTDTSTSIANNDVLKRQFESKNQRFSHTDIQ